VHGVLTLGMGVGCRSSLSESAILEMRSIGLGQRLCILGSGT
jgi:hypothetical protein